MPSAKVYRYCPTIAGLLDDIEYEEDDDDYDDDYGDNDGGNQQQSNDDRYICMQKNITILYIPIRNTYICLNDESYDCFLFLIYTCIRSWRVYIFFKVITRISLSKMAMLLTTAAISITNF